MSNEPLMRNHSRLNWTNIPGIQSHRISQEKIPVQVLGTGVFLRSNMAQGVIHEDRRTVPRPHGKEGGVGEEPVSSSSGCTSWVHPRLKAILSFSS